MVLEGKYKNSNISFSAIFMISALISWTISNGQLNIVQVGLSPSYDVNRKL